MSSRRRFPQQQQQQRMSQRFPQQQQQPEEDDTGIDIGKQTSKHVKTINRTTTNNVTRNL